MHAIKQGQIHLLAMYEFSINVVECFLGEMKEKYTDSRDVGEQDMVLRRNSQGKI